MKIETKLKTFIENNNLTFLEGTRNSDSVVICGYGLHINATEDEILDVVTKLDDVDVNIDDEISRVYRYAKANNYQNYWNTPEAKKQYTF